MCVCVYLFINRPFCLDIDVFVYKSLKKKKKVYEIFPKQIFFIRKKIGPA